MSENGNRRVGVYVCHCGSNIAGTVDVTESVSYAATLPHVAVAREYKYMCSSTGQEMIKRDIEDFEVVEAILRGEIIEEYPDDKYSPSCLISGKTGEGRSLHIQISFPPKVVIITVYEPDEKEWLDKRIRRR